MKQRSGSIYKRPDGSWWARVTWTIPGSDQRKQQQRRARNQAHARILRDELVRRVERDLAKGIQPERRGKTFADLADFYIANYTIPPLYVDGRKVSGLRAHQEMKRMVCLRLKKISEPWKAT